MKTLKDLKSYIQVLRNTTEELSAKDEEDLLTVMNAMILYIKACQNSFETELLLSNDIKITALIFFEKVPPQFHILVPYLLCRNMADMKRRIDLIKKDFERYFNPNI